MRRCFISHDFSITLLITELKMYGLFHPLNQFRESEIFGIQHKTRYSDCVHSSDGCPSVFKPSLLFLLIFFFFFFAYLLYMTCPPRTKNWVVFKAEFRISLRTTEQCDAVRDETRRDAGNRIGLAEFARGSEFGRPRVSSRTAFDSDGSVRRSVSSRVFCLSCYASCMT